jgi:hypothetical protein
MRNFIPLCTAILLSFVFSCNKSGSDGDSGFLVNPPITDPYSGTSQSTFSLSYDVVNYNAATLRRYAVVYHNDSQVGMACAVYDNNPGTYGKEVIKVIFYLNSATPLPGGNGTVSYSGTGTVIVKYCVDSEAGDIPRNTPQPRAMNMGSATGAISFDITRSGNSYTADNIALQIVNGKGITIGGGPFPVVRK